MPLKQCTRVQAADAAMPRLQKKVPPKKQPACRSLTAVPSPNQPPSNEPKGANATCPRTSPSLFTQPVAVGTAVAARAQPTDATGRPPLSRPPTSPLTTSLSRPTTSPLTTSHATPPLSRRDRHADRRRQTSTIGNVAMPLPALLPAPAGADDLLTELSRCRRHLGLFRQLSIRNRAERAAVLGERSRAADRRRAERRAAGQLAAVVDHVGSTADLAGLRPRYQEPLQRAMASIQYSLALRLGRAAIGAWRAVTDAEAQARRRLAAAMWAARWFAAGGAFFAWRQAAAKRAPRRLAGQRLAARRDRRLASGQLRLWAAAAAAQRDLADRQFNLLLRRRGQRLARALAALVSWTSRRRQLKVDRGFAVVMLGRHRTAIAFDGWHAGVLRLASRRRALWVAGARQLRRAFRLWAARAVEQLARDGAGSRLLQARSRRRWIVQAMRSWVGLVATTRLLGWRAAWRRERVVSHAVGWWAEWAAGRRGLRAEQSAAVQLLCRHRLAIAYDVWVRTAQQMARRWRVLEQFQVRVLRGRFHQWLRALVEASRDEAHKEAMARLVVKCDASMANIAQEHEAVSVEHGRQLRSMRAKHETAQQMHGTVCLRHAESAAVLQAEWAHRASAELAATEASCASALQASAAEHKMETRAQTAAHDAQLRAAAASEVALGEVHERALQQLVTERQAECHAAELTVAELTARHALAADEHTMEHTAHRAAQEARAAELHLEAAKTVAVEEAAVIAMEAAVQGHQREQEVFNERLRAEEKAGSATRLAERGRAETMCSTWEANLQERLRLEAELAVLRHRVAEAEAGRLVLETELSQCRLALVQRPTTPTQPQPLDEPLAAEGLETTLARAVLELEKKGLTQAAAALTRLSNSVIFDQ